MSLKKKKKTSFNRQMTEIKRNRVYLFCLCTRTYLFYQSNSFHFVHGKKIDKYKIKQKLKKKEKNKEKNK